MIDHLGSRAALAEWGRTLRAARSVRRRLVRRSMAVGMLSAALAMTIAWPARPMLVWNASASAPVGLYRVSRDTVGTGGMVIAWPPADIRGLAARRHYLPENIPLVKHVAAEAGDTVCAQGPIISIAGRPVAERRKRDGAGRPMPWWEGCVLLRHGALFLLVRGNAASFDGRYFGPTTREAIVGKATPLWVR